PDRLEATHRYTSMDFVSMDPMSCLEPRAGWGTGYLRGWSFRQRSGEYVDFEVTPSCYGYRSCQTNDFQAPPTPAECGSRTRAIEGDRRTISLTSGKSVSLSLVSTEIETETVCSIVQLPESICKSGEPRWVPARGRAHIQSVDSDGNVLENIRYRFTQNVLGFALDRVYPQEWRKDYSRREVDSFTTQVSAAVLPLDFPKAYTFSASVSHREGEQARFEFSSKYFTHGARLVSQADGQQKFEISSTLSPITSPNARTQFDPTNYTLTITDDAIAELAELDPKNAAVYTVRVYANWKRNLGDEKLGSILGEPNEKVVENKSNEGSLTISLSQDFLNHPKFKKEKFDGGGKDWEAYIEITTRRTNKYVQTRASNVSVTKFSIGKKKVLKSVENNFEKTDRYR
ncbi:MAG: hypothetical protein K2X47_13435, partial [Bdellovibrionales bacterium]|nr:hypothetical protein [Bdellovibrionales bacterium]